jgi:anti-anti-sigma factor
MESRQDWCRSSHEPAPTGRLGCTVDGASRAPCIRLTGSLDHSTITKFREVASTQLRESTAPITVDLSHLEDIDIAGVAGCVYISLTARQHDAQVVFASPTPTVRRVMEYTELDKLLDVE